MDYAHELPAIPLAPITTATDTSHGNGIILPESLWNAIWAWQNIKDEGERRRVGANIAQRMQELYGP